MGARDVSGGADPFSLGPHGPARVGQVGLDTLGCLGEDALLIEQLDVTFSATGAKVVSRAPRVSSGHPELTEAAIVVSEGRGVGAAEGFLVVEELTDVLGVLMDIKGVELGAGFELSRVPGCSLLGPLLPRTRRCRRTDARQGCFLPRLLRGLRAVCGRRAGLLDLPGVLDPLGLGHL
jgi:hypothetical protein